MPNVAVVLLVAGKSSRFRDRDKKPFADLNGRAVWLHGLELFAVRQDITQILVVVADEDRELFDRRYRANVAFLSQAKVVAGGHERVDSVQNALAALNDEAEFVAVHDGARPCLTRELLDAVLQKGFETGAAALAYPVDETVKRSNEQCVIVETVPRRDLWLMQTPQVFDRRLLCDAYARRHEVKGAITDDAQLVEAIGGKVHLVASERTNIKITTKADLALASAILQSRPKPKNVSFGPFSDEEQMWK